MSGEYIDYLQLPSHPNTQKARATSYVKPHVLKLWIDILSRNKSKRAKWMNIKVVIKQRDGELSCVMPYKVSSYCLLPLYECVIHTDYPRADILFGILKPFVFVT